MKAIKFNSNKLKGIIKEKGMSQKDIASRINLSESTFNLKINGNAYFTQEEIYHISNLLEIPNELYKDYFFSFKSLES